MDGRRSSPNRMQIAATVYATVSSTWSREQQMSFLINTYNAFTIKLILDNYPGITSIKDLGGLFINSPWDKDLFRLFSKKTTLNFIEHQLLRKLYKDPRVHFVLVCASISCPPLRNEAYVAANLEQQLDDATINLCGIRKETDLTRKRTG